MKAVIVTTLAALACSAALPANALIIIGTGAGSLQPPENVLFNNSPANGLTVAGVTNQTDTSVSITGGQTLAASGGQANVSAASGLINTAFTYNGVANQQLGFDLTNPAQAFTSAEFRIFVGGGTATQATLTFVDTAGQTFQNTFAIPSNGFFNAQAANGEQINFFSVGTNGSFDDARQIRLGGIGPIGLALPEPASWALMIMGVGGIGATLRRRRVRESMPA
jgi:PEP-CTERM motif